MDMRTISLFILFLVFLISCADERLGVIQGEWASWQSSYSSKIDQVKIFGDSIYLRDDFHFVTKGTFRLKDESLVLNIRGKDISSLSIGRVSDSSFVIDGVVLDPMPFSAFGSWGNFECKLIDIISAEIDHEKYFRRHFYMYKNNAGEIEFNDGETGFKYQDLSLLFRYPHNSSRTLKPMIASVLIGEDVEVVDLLVLYEYLNLTGMEVVELITMREGIATYQGVRVRTKNFEENRLKIQDEIMLIHGVSPLPPPRVPFSRESILSKGAEEVLIYSKLDIRKIHNSNPDMPLIVAIWDEISMEDYIAVLLEVKKLRNAKRRVIYPVIG